MSLTNNSTQSKQSKQSKSILMRLDWADRINCSTNGNPRYQFLATSADGSTQRFKTASDVSCAYGCDIKSLKTGVIMRVKSHQTARGQWIADHWSVDPSCLVEYEAERERAMLDRNIGFADPRIVTDKKGGAL